MTEWRGSSWPRSNPMIKGSKQITESVQCGRFGFGPSVCWKAKVAVWRSQGSVEFVCLHVPSPLHPRW